MAQQRRERLIVLKQVCGNGFLSVCISGIFLLLIVFCPVLWIRFVVVAIVAFVLFVSLLWGHRVLVLRQDAREKIIISSRN